MLRANGPTLLQKGYKVLTSMVRSRTATSRLSEINRKNRSSDVNTCNAQVKGHDIMAFLDPAHAHEIITKSLNFVENVTVPSSGSVKLTNNTRPVSELWLFQGINSQGR